MDSADKSLTLGERVRTERTRRGVSQSALARRTGVPQPAISRIEAGQEVPSLARFDRLLAGLGLRAGVRIEPLTWHRGDSNHYPAIRRMTPGERLEQAAAWGALASELRGKAAAR